MPRCTPVGLTARRLPQLAAADIAALGLGDNLPTAARHQLDMLARNATNYNHSSMTQTYRRHKGLVRAYSAARSAVDAVCIAAKRPALVGVDPTDPTAIAEFTAAAAALLGLSDEPNPAKKTKTARVKTVTYASYYGDDTYSYRAGSRGRRGDSHGHPKGAMDAATRRANLPGVSVRAYRRAVAAVNHLIQRNAVLAAERDREVAVAFGKSRLASTIGYDEFAAHPATAAFVAYYVARLGMRT